MANEKIRTELTKTIDTRPVINPVKPNVLYNFISFKNCKTRTDVKDTNKPYRPKSYQLPIVFDVLEKKKPSEGKKGITINKRCTIKTIILDAYSTRNNFVFFVKSSKYDQTTYDNVKKEISPKKDVCANCLPTKETATLFENIVESNEETTIEIIETKNKFFEKRNESCLIFCTIKNRNNTVVTKNKTKILRGSTERKFEGKNNIGINAITPRKIF